MARKTAVVVGSLGVIGRNLVHHLEPQDEWDIVGLSRRTPDFPTRMRAIAVDLLDEADCRAKLRDLTGATHVFYCAFQARPTWAEHNPPNLAMLANSVAAIEAASPGLERVVLVEGNKIYGSHLGPFKTPAKETDPPHMPPNFYWDQEQWLRERQSGKGWSHAVLRPHTVCGFALGSPMNIMTVIAVYAAISKELGLPLRFPGKPGAYNAVYQVTDSEHLARAMVWAAMRRRRQTRCSTSRTATSSVGAICGRGSRRCSRCRGAGADDPACRVHERQGAALAGDAAPPRAAADRL